MAITGQCLCGAVKFTATEVDTHLHACHCTMCRRWTGGPNLSAQASGVTFEGEEHIKAYSSSDWAERAFCSECGSNLYYRMKGADSYIMTAGSYNDDATFSLHGEIYIDEKPHFYDFAGDQPRMTGAEFLASMGIEVPEG